jgi:hypothetical protein
MPVVLNWCENWSLTLREERRLKVNMVLRRIFGPRSDEVTREWRKRHVEELNDLYSSPSIVRVIKWRMRWAVHVARIRSIEACTGFWWGNPRKSDHLGDPGIDGRIILSRIFRKWDVGYGLGRARSG